MPNHGKGGRKPLGDEVKRAQIPVRTTPSIKARLEEAAREAGRSLTQEIEQRLEASLGHRWDGLDTEAQTLIAKLIDDIRRAQAITNKRWYADLRTWAMVREALGAGEINRRCPKTDALFGSESEAAEMLAEIRQFDERLRALSISACELGLMSTPIPLNPDGFVDSTEPQYRYEDFIAEQKAHGWQPPNEDALLLLMQKMKEIEAERRVVALEYKLHSQAVMKVIDDAVKEWRDDQEARGYKPSYQYQPEPFYRPLRAPEPTGHFAPSEGHHFDEYEVRLRDRRLAELAERDDNA